LLRNSQGKRKWTPVFEAHVRYYAAANPQKYAQNAPRVETEDLLPPPGGT
jgi:hypothetical protein